MNKKESGLVPDFFCSKQIRFGKNYVYPGMRLKGKSPLIETK